MGRTKEFWTQIEADRLNGLSLNDVCNKYDISRNVIKRARECGKLNDVRDRPAKMNWNAVQKSIDLNGVDNTLIIFDTTMSSLYTAKQQAKINWAHRGIGKYYPTIYDTIDWNEIQKYYNENHSTTDIRSKFDIDWRNLVRATKSKKLILRPDEEKYKLALDKRAHTMGSLKWSEDKKRQHSIKMKQVVQDNPQSYSANNVCGRVKSYAIIDGYNNNTNVIGTWELLVAGLLNTNDIKWTNVIDGIPYSYNGNDHTYFPDFWLPDYNMYIEVKGYQHDPAKDAAKWESVTESIIILKQPEIMVLNETNDIITLLKLSP